MKQGRVHKTLGSRDQDPEEGFSQVRKVWASNHALCRDLIPACKSEVTYEVNFLIKWGCLIKLACLIIWGCLMRMLHIVRLSHYLRISHLVRLAHLVRVPHSVRLPHLVRLPHPVSLPHLVRPHHQVRLLVLWGSLIFPCGSASS